MRIFSARTSGITPVATIEAGEVDLVTVSDELLFVAVRGSGVLMYDISKAAEPIEIAHIVIPDAIGIAVRNEFAYVTTKSGSVEIVNIASPSLPVRYETVEVPSPGAIVPTVDAIYVAGDDRIHVLKNYNRGISFEVASVRSPGNAYRVTVHEREDNTRIAGISDHRGGVQIVRINDPWTVTTKSVVDSIRTEYANDVAFAGDYLYVADGAAGLRTVDIAPSFDTDPETAARIVNTWDTDGNARGIDVSGTRIYLADGNRGIKMFGTERPDRPLQIASIQTEYAVDLTVDGEHLFVADGDGGTAVFRIGASGLTRVATLDTGNTRCVTIDGSMLATAGSAGLLLFDITNPESPRRIGAYDTGYAERVALVDGYAYVAEGVRGLTILDVANPASIYVVSEFKNPFALDVAVAGKYAYLVDATGLRVIEVVIPDWVVRAR